MFLRDPDAGDECDESRHDSTLERDASHAVAPPFTDPDVLY